MTWDQTISDVDDGFGICGNCQKKRTSLYWCTSCEYSRYQKAFPSWSSGNRIIDKVIHDIQRDAPSVFSFLEWIPYNRFSEINEIGKGAFSTVQSAIWKEGPRDGPPLMGDFSMNTKSLPMWNRRKDCNVALKTLDNSEHVQKEFFHELKTICRVAPDGEEFENFSLRHVLRCYGITQNPTTKDYIMVMQYADKGDLNKVLARTVAGDKYCPGAIKGLKHIAIGLSVIHSAGLIHRDLHAGNVLQDGKTLYITDVGISRPIKAQKSPAKGVYGVMPYVAPEVLLGGSFSQAADIYSFGILMWEFLMNQRPFTDRPHDTELHLAIYNGLRPRIGDHVPSHLRELMQRCWDPDPKQRPTAAALDRLLNARSKMGSEDNIKIPRNLAVDIDFINGKLLPNHPGAVYTTRLLNFIDPLNACIPDENTCGLKEGAKSFIAHKIQEINKYQKEKGKDLREWKDQDFRLLVDWYYWTGR